LGTSDDGKKFFEAGLALFGGWVAPSTLLNRLLEEGL
jgi:hypothetical protein